MVGWLVGEWGGCRFYSLVLRGTSVIWAVLTPYAVTDEAIASAIGVIVFGGTWWRERKVLDRLIVLGASGVGLGAVEDRVFNATFVT